MARGLAIFAMTAALGGMAQTGDASRGAALFEACAGCHQIGAGARVSVGPVLTGVVGRPAAATEFAHSEALADAAAEGLHWDAEALDAFLADPDGFLPGTTMVFEGLSDTGDRAELIAFLADHSGETLGFAVPPEVQQIEGDAAYGEYLAGECTACHGNSAAGIPKIEGMAADRMVAALHAYRAGALSHPVMEMVASRLGDEDIAALAAWFAALD